MNPTQPSQATIYFVLAGLALFISFIAMANGESGGAIITSVAALLLGLRGFKIMPPKPYVPMNRIDPGVAASIHTFSCHARITYPPGYLLLTIAILAPEQEADPKKFARAELSLKQAISRAAAYYDQIKLDPNNDAIYPRIEAAIDQALSQERLFTSSAANIVAYDIAYNPPDEKTYPGVVIGL